MESACFLFLLFPIPCVFFTKTVESQLYDATEVVMRIIPEKCKGCLECTKVCPVAAISEKEGAITIDKESCLCCGCCASACPSKAISFDED